MFPESTRILIADDMLTMRQLVKGQLKGLGYSLFYEAENGEQAYTILTDQLVKNAPIGLVLSDWNMPVISGLELLKKVRANADFKTMPFMLITAEGEQHQVVEAIKVGVSNYLVKPFTRAGLNDKLKAVWKKHHNGSDSKT